MKKLYAIRDRVAMAIGAIMVFAADAAAVRAFGDVASNPETLVARHVEDFELVCLAEVSDSGVLQGLDRNYGEPQFEPIVVITGAQWKAAQAPAEVVD